MSDEAKVYARSKRRLWLLDLALTVALLLALVVSPLAQWLRGWVVSRISGWPLETAVYVGILGLGMTAVAFPLDWYRSFALEHRFRLSTQTFTQWLWEYGKRLIVGGVLTLLLVEILMGTLRAFPESWWIWAALFWMVWSILLTRVAPLWLIPIFYRQRPLEDAKMHSRLKTFLARWDARVHGIFEVNLSKTTRKANACLCGLGRSRRVLLSDTLLSTYPPEEVEVILAHEIGHHRMHHLGVLLVVSTFASGLGFFVVDHLLKVSMVPLQINGVSDLAGLPLIALGLILAGLVLLPLVNGISRQLETQADRFALKATGNPSAFITSMRRLAQQNLAEVAPPRWVEWILYDHPSIDRRIALAEASLEGLGNA